MRSRTLCAAQTTVSTRKMLIFTLEGMFRDGPLEARGDELTNLTPVRNAKDLNTIVGGRQCHRRLKLISTAIQIFLYPP